MRAKPIDSPPPAPYDIFLKRHECPVYRERRQANLSISKNPEENFSLKRIWFETLMLFYHFLFKHIPCFKVCSSETRKDYLETYCFNILER